MIARPPTPTATRALFASVFFIATCGLVYELVAGALASYLLGNSVTQFSLVIGTYLSAMGVGSWLSRHVDRNLVVRFVEVEIAVALLGGFSAPLLYAGFAITPAFRPLLFTVVALVGAGVGLELPLLLRILERNTSLKELVARALFLDYIGAFAASLVFPILLVPQLGLLRTSLVLGLVNAGVAYATTFLFDLPAEVASRLRLWAGGAVVLLSLGLAGAAAFEVRVDQALFADPVVYREASPYQKLVVTSDGHDTRLYLDGNLQFSTVDEYRYHEALVHPVMAITGGARVLVLGGGDGLAVREVLRHPVESVTLVDLDPAMTRLFSGRFASLNEGSLSDPRVTVVNADALTWLEEGNERFNTVIVDFPDPNDYALGKLYTTYFYRLLRARLAPGAAIAVQSTSPFYAAHAYWCVVRTVEASGFTVYPYHQWIPAFGDWGFVLATLDGVNVAPLTSGQATFPAGVRSLDGPTVASLFTFAPDVSRPDGPVNRLDNQVLVRLYEEDWREMVGR